MQVAPSRGNPTRNKPKADTEKGVPTAFRLTPDLAQQLRDAAVALQGPPLFLTLSGLVEEGLWRELKRLKKAYNEGKDFPHRPGKVRRGRPIR